MEGKYVMKRITLNILLMVLLFTPYLGFSQDKTVDFGNFSIFLSPKIMADGSITDTGLGLRYNNYLGGELRFRFTKT